MAYSNINKDNIQADRTKKLKMAILTIFLMTGLISAWTNIVQQIKTLREAEKRNREMEHKIEELEGANFRLKKEVETATASGVMSRKVREYLGFGSASDYWLTVDLKNRGEELKDKGIIVETKPKIVLWWNLFTK